MLNLRDRFPRLHLWLTRPLAAWQVWAWERANLWILKNGNVRDIQWAGREMVKMGEALDDPHIISTGVRMQEAAEKLVLRRTWSWRVRS